MTQITRVGADLAKRVIQVHGVDAGGKLVTNRALPRDKFIAWCAHSYPPVVWWPWRPAPAPTTGRASWRPWVWMRASSPRTWWLLTGCRAKAIHRT